MYSVVATVGGAGLWSPLLTSRAHHLGLKSRLEPTTHPQQANIVKIQNFCNFHPALKLL